MEPLGRKSFKEISELFSQENKRSGSSSSSAVASSRRRHRHVKVRPKTCQPTFSKFRKENVVALGRNHVELVARWNLLLCEPVIQPFEVLCGVLVLLDVVNLCALAY
jgi:hypothetical protein